MEKGIGETEQRKRDEDAAQGILQEEKEDGENCSITHTEGEGKNKQRNILRSIRLD